MLVLSLFLIYIIKTETVEQGGLGRSQPTYSCLGKNYFFHKVIVKNSGNKQQQAQAINVAQFLN